MSASRPPEQPGWSGRTSTPAVESIPSTEPVGVAASRAGALEDVAAAARARFDADRRDAERARTVAARAATELGHAAGSESLPTGVPALDGVVRAAGELARELATWEQRWQTWGECRAAAQAASERRAQRQAATEGAQLETDARRREHEDAAAQLAALEDAVGATVAEVLAAIGDCERARDATRAATPVAQRRAGELAEAAGRAAQVAADAAQAAESASSAVESSGSDLGHAVTLPGVVEAAIGPQSDAGWDWDPSDAVGSACALRAQLADEGSVSDQVVLNRVRDLEEGLAGGYDVAIGVDGGVMFFHVTDDTGRQPLPSVTARVVAEAARAKERLAANEREIIERFLLGELGEELRERLLESLELVASANRALAGVRTSHGKGVRLEWRIDQEAPAPARTASELLIRSPRSVEEDAALRDALMELIVSVRETDPAAGYLEHLLCALDYRRWYRFSVLATDDRRPGSARALAAPRALPGRAAGAVLPRPVCSGVGALRRTGGRMSPALAARRRVRQGRRADPRPPAGVADRARPRLPAYQRTDVGLLRRGPEPRDLRGPPGVLCARSRARPLPLGRETAPSRRAVGRWGVSTTRRSSVSGTPPRRASSATVCRRGASSSWRGCHGTSVSL